MQRCNTEDAEVTEYTEYTEYTEEERGGKEGIGLRGDVLSPHVNDKDPL
jgi:hypothetical protein